LDLFVFECSRERDDPPMKMHNWEVPTRYAIAIDYFKRAEVTMSRNYVVNDQLVRAIKSNQIALTMLLKRIDVSFCLTIIENTIVFRKARRFASSICKDHCSRPSL
jgi:hypothetical protein